MEAFSLIILVFLSLAAYSAGAVTRAAKSVDLKPRIGDILTVLVIWAGAIASLSILHPKKWLFLLVGAASSFVIGWLVVWPSKSVRKSGKKPEPTVEGSFFKRIWIRWKAFSRRMGSFQSRMILSLLYFIFILPFALGVKLFSDPLLIKKKTSSTHWLPKREFQGTAEQFRRQF